MIAPTLNHISTSLNAGRIVEKNVKGIYAAGAGVEDALWLLTEGIEPPEELQPLPENVNQMEVEVGTLDKGIYALYFGEILEITEIHYDWLAVAGEMELTEEEDVYKYTITVTWQPYPGEPDILLEDIGVRLPIGYSYQLGSAASFPDDNLFTTEPDDVPDWAGAHMLNWELPHPPPDPRPMVTVDNQTAKQIFYVTGGEEQEGDYTWVKGSEGQSIGEVGEATGTFYSITSIATHPESGATTIVADVLVDDTDGEIAIVLWQINPQ